MKIPLVFLAITPFFCSFAAESGVEDAIRKGAEYLLSAQHDDGHWSDGDMPALTALPVWALSQSGGAVGGAQKARLSGAVSNGVRFVLAAQKKDGGFYNSRPGRGGGGLGTYNTSVCVSALYLSRIAPVASILKARTFLADSQLTGDDTMAGGFGYDKFNPNLPGRGGRPPRRYADLSNTSYALSAMRLTAPVEEMRPAGGKKADIDWSRAIAFVENLQKKEGTDRGGAAYNERTPQGGTTTNAGGRVHLRAYGSMSYGAVLSMCSANLTKSDPRVKLSLEYCTKYWNVDENPGMGNQGLFYYYDILARALSAAGVDRLTAAGGKEIEWKRELASKLATLQKSDGSWANSNNRFWEADPVLCTSFAMIALELCR
ncbi:MAG: terpene cyclase/mutase family protein [Kiritimatiellae bacterium]|nr:terpene cyclase/mutase family protein [Kiritimatiellia bacterium]